MKKTLRKLKKKDFLAWLASRQDEESFRFQNPRGCVLALWLTSFLGGGVQAWASSFTLQDLEIPFPAWMLKLSQALDEIEHHTAAGILTMRQVKDLVKVAA